MKYVLFSGHMVDATGRTQPRFPPIKEAAVKIQLQKILSKLKNNYPHLKGIAGGACGGDILFHEVCAALEIPSQIYFALPVDEFKTHSVSFAGNQWEERLDNLLQILPSQVMHKTDNTEENIWEQANNWMLEDALTLGGENMILVVLWDMKKGDGKGGTENMVDLAKSKGGCVEIININQL